MYPTVLTSPASNVLNVRLPIAPIEAASSAGSLAVWTTVAVVDSARLSAGNRAFLWLRRQDLQVFCFLRGKVFMKVI